MILELKQLNEDNKPKKWLVFQNTVKYCDWLKISSTGGLSIQGGTYAPCRYIGCFSSVDARKFQIDAAKGDLSGNIGILYSTIYESLEGKSLITQDKISEILSYPNKDRSVRNGKGESLFSFFQIDYDSDEDTEMKKVPLVNAISKATAIEWIGYLIDSSNFDKIPSPSFKDYILKYKSRYDSLEDTKKNVDINLEDVLYSLYDEKGNTITPSMFIESVPIEDKISLQNTSYIDTIQHVFSRYGRSNLIYGFTVKGSVAYIGVTKSSSSRGKQYAEELLKTTDGRLLVQAFSDNLIDSMIIFKSNFPLIGSRLSIDLNIVRPLEKQLCSVFNTYPAKYPTALNSAKPGTNCGKYSFSELIKINKNIDEVFSSGKLLTANEYFNFLATLLQVSYNTAVNSDYLPNYEDYVKQLGLIAFNDTPINWEILKNIFSMGRDGRKSGNIIFDLYWGMKDVEKRLLFKHQFKSVEKNNGEFETRATQYAKTHKLETKNNISLLTELLQTKQYEKFRKVYLEFPNTCKFVLWPYYISLTSESERQELFDKAGLADTMKDISTAENRAQQFAKRHNISFVPIKELIENNIYNIMNSIDDKQSLKDRTEN